MKVASSLIKVMWALPATLAGLGLAILVSPFGVRLGINRGVLEVNLVRAPLNSSKLHLPFAAITLGHVVVAASPQHQARLRAHERVHVAQYERWGPLFLVAYPAESLYQWLRGRRPYWDNRFEIEARHLGGNG